MPFTLSHSIAVFPFRRISDKYLSMTGLIAGSMAPDFEFFLRVTLYGDISHTWLGFFIFDFPVAILIAVLFHWIIKEPLINNMPLFLHKRLIKYRDTQWLAYFKEHFIVVLISALIGIFTHFVWDNLTHEPGYISSIYFDFLLTPIPLFKNIVPLYHVLQIFSSFIGIVVILFTLWRLPIHRGTATIHINKSKYWISVFIFALLLTVLRYLIGVPTYKPFGQIIVISISTSLFSLLFVSSYYKWLKTN
jgi:hypothetical protein